MYSNTIKSNNTIDTINIMNLELSYLTCSEKMDIMTTIPIKQHVTKVGKTIIKKRIFTDEQSKQDFELELKKLIIARSTGVPSIMKKNKH